MSCQRDPTGQSALADIDLLSVAGYVKRSRAKQGLPPTVEDEVVIARVLVLAGISCPQKTGGINA